MSLPIFRGKDTDTVGESCLKRSACSLTMSYIWSSDTEREEPRPMIITVRESVSRSAKLSSI